MIFRCFNLSSWYKTALFRTTRLMPVFSFKEGVFEKFYQKGYSYSQVICVHLSLEFTCQIFKAEKDMLIHLNLIKYFQNKRKLEILRNDLREKSSFAFIKMPAEQLFALNDYFREKYLFIYWFYNWINILYFIVQVTTYGFYYM